MASKSSKSKGIVSEILREYPAQKLRAIQKFARRKGIFLETEMEKMEEMERKKKQEMEAKLKSGRQNITALNMTIDPAQSHTGETDYRFPADEASRQMQETKKRFNADEGRQAYHAEQSFFPGEVTPEEAHRIGVEFAKKAWGDFEVVVATHVDKKGSYAEEKLYDRIQANLAGGSVAPETQYLYAAYRMRRVRTFVYLSRRKRSHLYGGCLYGTYLAYRHLAKLQKQGRGYTPYPNMRMRETARDLRRFSDRTVLLCDNHIHTRSELSEYQLRLKKTKEELTSQRQILRAQLRRTEEGEEITPVREEIERLNGEIKEASYQLRLCGEIDGEAELVERELEDLVQEAEQEQKQEMERQY